MLKIYNDESDEKDKNLEQCKIVVTEVDARTAMLMKDERKKEKERAEHKYNFHGLQINNNQLRIEIKKEIRNFR